MSRSLFGTIQYLSEGRYRIHWTESGKRKSKVIRGTRDDAEIALAQRRLQTTGEIEDMTWDAYWEIVVEPTFVHLSQRTEADYRRVWKKELQPRIGKLMVGSTNRKLVQKVISSIEAPSVQRYALKLWRKMCNLDDDILPGNPVRNIHLKPLVKKKKKMIEASTVNEWMESIRGIKHEPLLLMELGGGLNPEEACGMVWEKTEVIEQDGQIYFLATVDRVLTVVESKKILKEPKNQFRAREVVIGEPFASRLAELRKDFGPVCPGRIVYYEGDEYEVCHFASPWTITHNWREWCKRNDMEYVPPGNLRSVYATLHGEAGSVDSLVSMSMGHSGSTTKARNYQQNTRPAMILIADNLADYIARAQERACK